jgi:hypothetical protein
MCIIEAMKLMTGIEVGLGRGKGCLWYKDLRADAVG